MFCLALSYCKQVSSKTGVVLTQGLQLKQEELQKRNIEHLPPFTSLLKMAIKTRRICICAFLQCLRATGKLCLISTVLTMNLFEVFCSDYSLGCNRISRSRDILFVLVPWALFASLSLHVLVDFHRTLLSFKRPFELYLQYLSNTLVQHIC